MKALTQLRQLLVQSSVHIAPATDYDGDLADIVCRKYESFRERLPLAGKRVVHGFRGEVKGKL